MGETPGDDEGVESSKPAAGTREELERMFLDAGQGRFSQWLDHPAALLSGLVPAEAITDPETAARARLATRRFLDHLPEPIPDGVRVVAARLVDPDGYLLELDFWWPDGSDTRRIDARPYLWGSVFDEMREDQTEFAQFFVDRNTVCWPGDVDLAPELLYGASWSVDTDRPPSRP